jgi:hypothetical protein
MSGCHMRGCHVARQAGKRGCHMARQAGKRDETRYSSSSIRASSAESIHWNLMQYTLCTHAPIGHSRHQVRDALLQAYDVCFKQKYITFCVCQAYKVSCSRIVQFQSLGVSPGNCSKGYWQIFTDNNCVLHK